MNDQNEPKINPNTASLEELMQLPGIGAEMAQRIVDARPFENPEDLQRVSGIGSQVLDDILPHLDLPMPERGLEVGTVTPAEEPVEQALEAEEAQPEQVDITDQQADVRAPTGDDREIEALEAAPPALEITPEPPPLAEGTESHVFQPEEAQPGATQEKPAAEPHADQPSAATAARPAAEQPAPATRGQLVWVTGGCSLVALVVAVLLALAIMAAVNGGRLLYASPGQVNELVVQVRALERASETLNGDITGLRQRIDNLESLGNRVEGIEERVQVVEGDLGSLDEQVNELSQAASEMAAEVETMRTELENARAENQRARDFFQGLRELLGNLYPSEEVEK